MTQPPHPPEPPEKRHTSGSPSLGLLTGLIGFVVFVVVSVLTFFRIVVPGLSVRADPLLGAGDSNVMLIILGTAIQLLVAIAGAVLAVRGTHYFVKGLGIGLMIGWALMSIVSAGICTGVNPNLYLALPI